MSTKTLPQGNKMGTWSIGKLLVNMALPLVISMLVQALYNVVDSIYVSRISESAVTALSLAFPIQNLLIGCATGVGVGVNSLLSKSLGEQNLERANRTAGNGMLLSVLFTALFVIFGLFFARPFFATQTTVTETLAGGSIYLAIVTIGSIGIFVEILFERLLQASGNAFQSMVTQTVGAVTNIILDPILIFGWFRLPAMGIAGAALATVIGQWIAAILAMYLNLKYNKELKELSRRHMKPDGYVVRTILSVGVPSIIMVGIGSIMNFGVNQILQGFSETATGVFGIYFKLQSFFFMPLFGINNAVISIVAFNYGARRPDRMMKTLKLAAMAGLGIMLVGLAVFQFMPEVLLSIFDPSDEFMRMAVRALRTISWCFPVAAVCIILGSTFQALGTGIYATLVSLARQLIVLLPAAYLLSLSGEVTRVWWAWPIAESMGLTMTLIFFLRNYRQRIKPLYEV
ncbi:MAG: MATE family efflux transporter [Oscillospiraceae bacterium]|nr:MATE family efflux transporter [Oscillospiraceae bacterium]